MKKQTKKAKKVAAKKVAKPPTAKQLDTIFKGVRRDLDKKNESIARQIDAERVAHETAAAAPTQAWRKNIDWVAAGKKAYETRMKNLAVRQAAAGATPSAPAIAAPAPRKALPAPAAPVTEADTPRRSRHVSSTRTTAGRRRSTTSSSSSASRK
jgi:hypothetical protein